MHFNRNCSHGEFCVCVKHGILIFCDVSSPHYSNTVVKTKWPCLYVRSTLKMWSQSLLARAVWTACGKPVTPPSLCRSTGVTASWVPFWASLCHWSGASFLLVCLSATSGLLCPALRAVWLNPSVWVSSIRCSYTDSLTHSSKQWGRCTAESEWFYARRCKFSMAALFKHGDQFLFILSMEHQATNKQKVQD